MTIARTEILASNSAIEPESVKGKSSDAFEKTSTVLGAIFTFGISLGFKHSTDQRAQAIKNASFSTAHS